MEDDSIEPLDTGSGSLESSGDAVNHFSRGAFSGGCGCC